MVSIETVRRLALASALVAAAMPASAGAVKLFQQGNRDGVTTARVAAPIQSAGVGWQPLFDVAVPQGQNLIATYTCPSDAKVPVGNSFSPNTAAKNGLQLITSFHPKPTPQLWQWEIHWPAGAPSNSHIFFSIYCVK